MEFTDTHCHLDFNSFDEDRNEVLNRAVQAGLARLLNPGVDLSSSQRAVELANHYSPVYAAVGVHPNEALGWQKTSLVELEELAANPKVVAIGEIGLDYYRDRAPRDLQMSIFREQLELAEGLGLPVIIHNRDASQEILNTLTTWQYGLKSAKESLAEYPGVLHSFQGDGLIARRAIDLNFMIGITGPITFKNAVALQETIASLELTNLLVETDAPFLTPVPHRGERNEPALVRYVLEKIAEILHLPDTTVASETTANASRIFHW